MDWSLGKLLNTQCCLNLVADLPRQGTQLVRGCAVGSQSLPWEWRPGLLCPLLMLALKGGRMSSGSRLPLSRECFWIPVCSSSQDVLQ